MQVKNDYHLGWTKFDGTTGEGVYNGDLGILCEIDRRASTVTVQMDDRLVLYELETAAELELAYAMTVHKSQGNEFPAVVMPIFPGPLPAVIPQSAVYGCHTGKGTFDFGWYPAGIGRYGGEQPQNQKIFRFVWVPQRRGDDA